MGEMSICTAPASFAVARGMRDGLPPASGGERVSTAEVECPLNRDDASPPRPRLALVRPQIIVAKYS